MTQLLNDFLSGSAAWGVLLTLAAFALGTLINKVTGKAIFNPLLLGSIFVIIFLSVCSIPYADYKASAAPVNYLLLPATVALAIPLYEKIDLLKENAAAIIAGISVGTLVSLGSALALALALDLTREQYATLLPKSVTTAISMDVAAELGGIAALTGAIVIVTGIVGALLAETVCKMFHITDPIAKGVGIGTSAHAVGTSKALQMGEVEGAMSGLSIAVAGVLTGIAIGFSKGARYWIYPLVRVLGPIPSTAWIPLAMISFPTVVSASAFLIALAVWFPTSVLTASGISSIPNAYFEAAATLGASNRYALWKVGIPAAMPHMFLGLFNGTTASFITLVTAEMMGAKYGIGWYVNWQKDMMAYANVYAGLIVMSVICYCIITLLFRSRDHVLVWQKGVIKW